MPASHHFGWAQTQSEYTQSARAELRAAESELNDVLASLIEMAEGNPSSVAKLKQAQAAWEAFRDAHIKAYWPSEEPGWYGSAHPMCVAFELTRLTKARVTELREMTNRTGADLCVCLWPD